MSRIAGRTLDVFEFERFVQPDVCFECCNPGPVDPAVTGDTEIEQPVTQGRDAVDRG